jgi:hypothetical protein
MNNQEYILLILNCKKYFKKALYQKMTWLSTLPSYLKYYHVIGDEGLDTDFKFDEDSDVLWVKTADDYNSLPKKVIYAYNAVHKTFNYKYIFKTDDDQQLTDTNFFNITRHKILTHPKQTHYGGEYIIVEKDTISTYNLVHSELPNNLVLKATTYCSGRFYYLSRDAVEHLLTHKEEIENEYLEDYAIGFYLDTLLKKEFILIKSSLYLKDVDENTLTKFFKR